MLKLGNLDVIKIYLGDIEVPRAYLGDIEVYSLTPKESYAVATFNVEEDGQHCILGDSYYFDYNQLDRITIDGEDYDFKRNGRLANMTAGEHTVIYYPNDSLTSMADIWQYCSGMTSIDVSNLDVSNVVRIRSAFNFCYSLTDIIGLDKWNISKIVDMGYLFYNCKLLTSIDLSFWDLSNVLDMDEIFGYCDSLTEVTMIGNLNPAVTLQYPFNMVETDGTFYYDDTFASMEKIIEKLPSTWVAKPLYMKGYNNYIKATFDITDNSSEVVILHTNNTPIEKMFIDGVEYAPTNRFQFDTLGEHIVYYIADAENVTSIDRMFESVGLPSTANTVSFDVKKWDVTNVTDLNATFMSANLTDIIGLDTWNVSNVTSIVNLFNQVYYPKTLNVFPQIENWNVSNVTDFTGIFMGILGVTSIDLSGWDLTNATKTYNLFGGMEDLEMVVIPDISNSINAANMFINCNSLTTVKFVGGINPNVDASNMFSGVTTTGTLYYNSDYDYSKVIEQLPSTWTAEPLPKESYAVATFYAEYDGYYYILGNSNYFDYSQLDRITIDGEDYDFMNNGREVYLTEGEHTVTYYAKATMTACNDIWVGCGCMTSIDVSKWNTAQITTIRSAFHTCSSLTSIVGLDKWNTSNITDMGYLFYECLSLNSIDLSFWDLSNVLDMRNMFNTAISLTSLYVNSPLNSGVHTSNMFSGVETDGTFYYNDEYDNTAIIGAIPSTWTAVPYNFE